MPADLNALAAELGDLARRVDTTREHDRLRAVFMELAPLMGAIQGAITQAIRERGTSASTHRAQQSMDALRAASRQVGFDIRLASPAAIAEGLRTALEHAELAVGALQEGE